MQRRVSSSAVTQTRHPSASESQGTFSASLFQGKTSPEVPRPGFSKDHEQLKDTYFSTSSRQLLGIPRKHGVTPTQECGPRWQLCPGPSLVESLHIALWPGVLSGIPGRGPVPLTMARQAVLGVSVPPYLWLPHSYFFSPWDGQKALLSKIFRFPHLPT